MVEVDGMSAAARQRIEAYWEQVTRFERAAKALAAGKAVSVDVREFAHGPAEWLQELRSYLLVDHVDPGDEITYKVYVTVSNGRAVARAKKVYDR